MRKGGYILEFLREGKKLREARAGNPIALLGRALGGGKEEDRPDIYDGKGEREEGREGGSMGFGECTRGGREGGRDERMLRLGRMRSQEGSKDKDWLDVGK